MASTADDAAASAEPRVEESGDAHAQDFSFLINPHSATKRVLPFGGRAVDVIDCSNIVREVPSVNVPGLQTISVGNLFKPGTCFLGVGQPNVYLAHVIDKDSVRIVAAKSLYREETRVAETHGRVQSGIFFIATNLAASEVDEIREMAMGAEGKKHVTCLKAVGEILAKSGFEFEGASLTDFVLPHTFLNVMLQGLQAKFRGRRLRVIVVKTTPRSLDSYFSAVRSATTSTPFRHLTRFLDSDKARAERLRIAKEMALQNEQLLAASNSPPSSSSTQKSPGNSTGEEGLQFTVLVSETHSLGALFRKLWGAHVIYKLQLTPGMQSIVQVALPGSLKEFEHAKGLAAGVKKNVLFNRTMVGMIRAHMTSSFSTHEGFSQANLLRILQQQEAGDGTNAKRYNIVVTTREVIFIANETRFGFVDWLLSKHVLVSGYSSDVRFAGEVYLDADGFMHISANSGTYRPTIAQLTAVVECAKRLFAGLTILGDMDSVQPGKEEVLLVVEEGKGAAGGEVGEEEQGGAAQQEEHKLDEEDDMWIALAPEGEEEDAEEEASPEMFDEHADLEVMRQMLDVESTTMSPTTTTTTTTSVVGTVKNVAVGAASTVVGASVGAASAAAGAVVYVAAAAVSVVSPTSQKKEEEEGGGAKKKKKRIGVLLAKFDPLTIDHEQTIEAALAAGVFEHLVVVASDVIAGALHTPVLDRQNMIDERYADDPRIITFPPHSVRGSLAGLGCVTAICKILVKSGYDPMAVILQQDYDDDTKRKRLDKLMPCEHVLLLCPEAAVRSGDHSSYAPNVHVAPCPTPRESKIVRTLLEKEARLFQNDGLLVASEDEVPLSPAVRAYIYRTQLYHHKIVAGNMTNAFRSVFGTGLGSVMGRVHEATAESTEKMMGKLSGMGIKI